jgi:hypothetical protein
MTTQIKDNTDDGLFLLNKTIVRGRWHGADLFPTATVHAGKEQLFLEKLTVVQPVNNFFAVFETQRFISGRYPEPSNVGDTARRSAD